MKKDTKQKITIEYEVETGKCSVTCVNMTKRSEAYKVLQKATKIVYKTWGGKGGLEAIGIKSVKKEENIKIAKEHRKQVAVALKEKLRLLNEVNKSDDDGKNKSKTEVLKDESRTTKSKANTATG